MQDPLDVSHLIRAPQPKRAKRPYDEDVGKWAQPKLKPKK